MQYITFLYGDIRDPSMYDLFILSQVQWCVRMPWVFESNMKNGLFFFIQNKTMTSGFWNVSQKKGPFTVWATNMWDLDNVFSVKKTERG